MFLELDAAVKDHVLKNVPREGPIRLLTDQETDISVTSQLNSFIQFLNKALGKTDTAFLGIQDVLEEHDVQIKKTITEKMEHFCQEDGSSVESAGEFIAALQFLHRFADSQTTAAGLLKKVQDPKFVGTFSVLGDILSIVRELSCSRAGISTSPKLAPA